MNYTVRAQRARAYLNKHFNDIDLYIEDRSCRNMYLLMFRKILGPNIKLRNINQVGTKSGVIELCKKDQADTLRKRLYIIDGDLDLLLGLPKPRLKHLYRLNTYCVENLLLDSSAIVDLCIKSDPNADESDIDKRLAFGKWLNETTLLLAGLFIAYAAARKLNVHFETVGFSVIRLCERQGARCILSRDLIKLRIKEVIKKTSDECGRTVFFATYRDVRALIKKNRWPTHRHISGKTYLLPLIQNKLIADFKFKGDSDQLKTHLASSFHARNEPYLARRLRSVMKGA